MKLLWSSQKRSSVVLMQLVDNEYQIHNLIYQAESTCSLVRFTSQNPAYLFPCHWSHAHVRKYFSRIPLLCTRYMIYETHTHPTSSRNFEIVGALHRMSFPSPPATISTVSVGLCNIASYSKSSRTNWVISVKIFHLHICLGLECCFIDVKIY